MSLSKKYGIEESKIKALIKDGWISCSAPSYEEIYYFYKSEVSAGVGSKQAVHNTSIKAKVSERQVYNIIHKFK
jgi:hypothetical protein